MWDVTFPSTTVVFYTKPEEIFRLFGQYKEKRFWAGSYAVLVPNLAIKYLEKREGFQVRFLYHVYNQSNILRWPTTEIFVDFPGTRWNQSQSQPQFNTLSTEKLEEDADDGSLDDSSENVVNQ
eukprot:TRINITY_DN6586_c0_g4_i1.p2 TRINITY_DN6586_c0_g4~~TRINITY_DN6586_c0_g4_i1.p2  ORF type:complete len:123 (-),score=33.65 TRINITY_DN6586_c0_g4_i1:54-422(-)